jgi:hypothetical protein
MDATGQAGPVSSGQVPPAKLLDAATERITDLGPSSRPWQVRSMADSVPVSPYRRALDRRTRRRGGDPAAPAGRRPTPTRPGGGDDAALPQLRLGGLW